MDHRERTVVASAAIVGIFLLVQLGALALVEPFQQEGHQFVEDTDDPSLSILYVLVILVATVFMLATLKRGGASMLRVLIIFAGAYISFFVLALFSPAVLEPTVGGVTIPLVPLVGAGAIGLALFVYPEWYVIDAAGILMGIGAAGLFGINLGILPALVLLVVLAIYDAISVYGTEHMLTLASGVMDMRVPVVLVVPLSLSYTFLNDDRPASLEDTDGAVEEAGEHDSTDGGEETAEAGLHGGGESDPLTAEELNELGPDGVVELDASQVAALDRETLEAVDTSVRERIREEFHQREAIFIGLGDAVIPTILVASAAFFVDAGPTIWIGVATAPLAAVTAMAGTLLGLVGLLWLVSMGRAHAGLPLLNGGAIAGYLVGALVSGLTLVEALGLSGFV